MTHNANKKLFLSAVSSEFSAYRQLLAKDLLRPSLDVAVQDDFLVTDGTTLEKLDVYIQACAGVVHLIGKATGAVPAALLRGLVASSAGLCVVTTREKVDEIKQHYGRSAIDPLDFLSPLAGAALLHFAGARRAGEQQIEPNDQELAEGEWRGQWSCADVIPGRSILEVDDATRIR